MSTVDVWRVLEEVWIGAPPERVFRSLTDPEAVTRWWAVPEAYNTTEAEIELRPGGRFRFGGTSAGGGRFQVTGEYRRIKPPDLLEHTWHPDWDDEAKGSMVTWRLEP